MARRGKKLSLDGTVPGVEYNGFHGGYGSGPLDDRPQVDLPHLHADYHPHPGHMDIPVPDYDGYTAHSAQPRMPELRLDPVEWPERPVRYEDSLITQGQFDAAMQSFLMDQQHAATDAAEREVFQPVDPVVEPGMLEQLAEEPIPPGAASEMASDLEQLAQQMMPPPPMPEPDEFEQYQQPMDPFGMPGLFGP